MRKIVALLGSGVAEGNTERLLQQVVCGAEGAGCFVETFCIPKMNISPCVQSYGCMFENRCMIDDDANTIIQKLKTCDGIIIASPIMTYGIPGSLKCFMDRCQAFYFAQKNGAPLVKPELAKRRRTLFISISGMGTGDVFDGAKATVKAWCSIVSSEYFDELLQNDMDTIGRIENKPGLCETAFEKGKKLGEELARS
ncbi:MAG TPA: flavodoxin family protein [Methanocorpusculum sp.]|nr:flavodoxin family protein [Methanocorpusculum sp.]